MLLTDKVIHRNALESHLKWNSNCDLNKNIGDNVEKTRMGKPKYTSDTINLDTHSIKMNKVILYIHCSQ